MKVFHMSCSALAGTSSSSIHSPLWFHGYRLIWNEKKWKGYTPFLWWSGRHTVSLSKAGCIHPKSYVSLPERRRWEVNQRAVQAGLASWPNRWMQITGEIFIGCCFHFNAPRLHSGLCTLLRSSVKSLKLWFHASFSPSCHLLRKSYPLSIHPSGCMRRTYCTPHAQTQSQIKCSGAVNKCSPTAPCGHLLGARQAPLAKHSMLLWRLLVSWRFGLERQKVDPPPPPQCQKPQGAVHLCQQQKCNESAVPSPILVVCLN